MPKLNQTNRHSQTNEENLGFPGPLIGPVMEHPLQDVDLSGRQIMTMKALTLQESASQDILTVSRASKLRLSAAYEALRLSIPRKSRRSKTGREEITV